MSSNTNGPSSANEIADYEQNLRYFLLRIFLEGIEDPEALLTPCELVKHYLPYALVEYGSNIMPHVLRLVSLEDLHGYLCNLLIIVYSKEQLELNELHAFGQVIGECEKGICAKRGEHALRGNRFFNNLKETLRLSADQRDCLLRGRGAGWNTDLDWETRRRRAEARQSVAASMADSDVTALARGDTPSVTSTADSVLGIPETAVNHSNRWNYVMSNRGNRPRTHSNATTVTLG
jgi:hypothetical protein